jgi:hypothetical protein
LQLAGHTVEVDMHTNCSVLPKARNEIVMRFLKSGFDKLLFLDTDMVWDAKDIFSLLEAEHDFCSIDYRKKTDAKTFQSTLTGREKDGWLQATGVGFGLTCLTKSMVKEMTEKHPDLRYVNEHNEICFSLFDFLLHGGRYWGEDYTFCRRWVECGGEIAVLADAETGHIGTKNFKGNRNRMTE